MRCSSRLLMAMVLTACSPPQYSGTAAAPAQSRQITFGACTAKISDHAHPKKLHPFTVDIDIRACESGANQLQDIILSASMPAMPMGLAPVVARRVAAGKYRADIVFTMAGRWHVALAHGNDAAGVEYDVD